MFEQPVTQIYLDCIVLFISCFINSLFLYANNLVSNEFILDYFVFSPFY